MELAELIGLRPLPCAGILLTVTRRCPLRCAHCSSRSTMDSERPDPDRLLHFVDSFGSAPRPEVLMMTGGEPLLLPGLVARLAGSARRAGTRSAVLTGGFFAGTARIPARLMTAIRAVDHFSVSIDAYHERWVARRDVFRLLRAVLDAGVPVSVHAVGTGPDDPYLADLVAHCRRVFGDRVPMLVNTLRPAGRAASWATARPAPPDPDRVMPCAMAAWPVVAHDGAVVACCNQDTVDRRPIPAHLRLGHVDTDDWTAVRERALSSPVLRMIRVTGPTHLLHHHARAGSRGDGSGDGYCAGCRRIGEHPEAVRAVRALASGAAGELLDRHAARLQVEAGPVAFVRRHGCPRYAGLVASATGGAASRRGEVA